MLNTGVVIGGMRSLIQGWHLFPHTVKPLKRRGYLRVALIRVQRLIDSITWYLLFLNKPSGPIESHILVLLSHFFQ